MWPCGVPAQATAGPMRVRSMPYMISLIISSPGRAAALAFSPHQAKAATSVLLRLHFSLIPSQSSPLSFRTCRPVHHPPLYSTLCSLPLHAPFPSACCFSSRLIITRAYVCMTATLVAYIPIILKGTNTVCMHTKMALG